MEVNQNQTVKLLLEKVFSDIDEDVGNAMYRDVFMLDLPIYL